MDKIDEEITHLPFNKQLFNTLTGLAAITERKHSKVQIAKSKNGILKFIHKQTANSYIKREGNFCFYGNTNKTAKHSYHLLLYIEILDHFNNINHQRATGTGGLIIARHIDSFYVFYPTNTNHLSEKEGDYKPLEFKPLINHKKARDAPFKHRRYEV